MSRPPQRFATAPPREVWRGTSFDGRVVHIVEEGGVCQVEVLAGNDAMHRERWTPARELSGAAKFDVLAALADALACALED